MYKTGVPIRFFYIFYELFDSYDATRVSYRRFVGKTGREETGNTEKRGLFGMWLLWKRETHSIYQMRQRSMYLKFRKEFVLGS